MIRFIGDYIPPEPLEEIFVNGHKYIFADGRCDEKSCWIPCSERLPEENGEYLVTVKKGYRELGIWVGIENNWSEVIAWMPLPEPYKAESEDDEV